jgi:hypothetical protein
MASRGTVPPAFDPDAFMAQRSGGGPRQVTIANTKPGAMDHVSAFVDGFKTAPILPQNWGSTLKGIGATIAHPIDSAWEGHEQAVNRADAAFKSGDPVQGIFHEGLSLLPYLGPVIDQYYQEAKDAQAKGDTVGETRALGKLVGLGASGEVARNLPDVIKAVPGAISKTADVAGSVGTGLKAAAPNVVGGTAMLGAGELASNIPGAGLAARLILDYPGVRMIGAGIKKGVTATLADLAAKRAAAADAVAAAQKAAQDAATAIKGAPLPETPTEAPAAPEVIPPERQLPPASAPPIVAGPITPRADMAPPVTSVPDTSGPIPTDRVTGRPIAASATPPVANATSEVAAPEELVSLDEIAKGLGSGIKGFKDLTAQQQALAQQVYDEIHAGPTYVAPAPAPEPSATSPTAVPANEPIASQPETAPVANESTTPPEVPRGTSPEQTSTPRKSRGFDELNAQITADLAKQKPPSVPASTPEDASDAAKIVFRDGSVAHLTPEQTQALHDYVTGKGGETAGKSDNPIPTAYRSKSQTGLQIPQEAAARDAIAQTAAENLYKTGIKPEQIRALTPDAQKLFWDNLSQLEGLSPQAHYSMSPATIDATMGKLVKMSKGGAVAPPAPVPPQVTISGKPVAGMSAQQIAEMLQQEMMK